jgi:hypothetical protein
LRKYLLRKNTFIDKFEISRYPITNFEYSKFVADTGQETPLSWPESVCPVERNSHPIVTVSYFDAVAFCKWLSKKSGKKYRLPDRLELEVASGILDLIDYPWGNDADSKKCNVLESDIDDTTPVGTYFDIKSKYGVQDLVGNVWEFTQSHMLRNLLFILIPCAILIRPWILGVTITLVIGFYLFLLMPFTYLKGGAYYTYIEHSKIHNSKFATFELARKRNLVFGFRVVCESNSNRTDSLETE